MEDKTRREESCLNTGRRGVKVDAARTLTKSSAGGMEPSLQHGRGGSRMSSNRPWASHHYWGGCLLSQRRRIRGLHDPCKARPSSLFILFGWSSNSVASLVSLSMESDMIERVQVSWNLMRWSWLKLCSATANLCGCPSCMCWSCSFILVSVDWPDCPMYTWPHLQGYCIPLEFSVPGRPSWDGGSWRSS